MTETEIQTTQIEVTPNGDFLNIKPKKQLSPGQGIVVTKKYAEALTSNDYTPRPGDMRPGKYGAYGIASVQYDGVDVTFFLSGKKNNDEIKMFDETGGEGDQVLVYVIEERVVNPKTEATMLVKRLRFKEAE